MNPNSGGGQFYPTCCSQQTARKSSIWRLRDKARMELATRQSQTKAIRALMPSIEDLADGVAADCRDKVQKSAKSDAMKEGAFLIARQCKGAAASGPQTIGRETLPAESPIMSAPMRLARPSRLTVADGEFNINIAERLAEVLDRRPRNRFRRLLAVIDPLMKLVTAGAAYIAASVAIASASNTARPSEPHVLRPTSAPQYDSLGGARKEPLE